MVLYLKECESLSHKEAMCHVWLKLIQGVWRKRLLNFDNGFLLFGPFQFERAWPYIWTNFTLFKQEMLFEIGWPVILEEEIVRFRWCIIAILLSSLLWKDWGPLFKQTWIPFTKECFVPNLGWNCPSGSAEEDF